jgi:hypothetical protein
MKTNPASVVLVVAASLTLGLLGGCGKAEEEKPAPPAAPAAGGESGGNAPSSGGATQVTPQ